MEKSVKSINRLKRKRSKFFAIWKGHGRSRIWKCYYFKKKWTDKDLKISPSESNLIAELIIFRYCECEPSPVRPDQRVETLDHKLSDLVKSWRIERNFQFRVLFTRKTYFLFTDTIFRFFREKIGPKESKYFLKMCLEFGAFKCCPYILLGISGKQEFIPPGTSGSRNHTKKSSIF